MEDGAQLIAQERLRQMSKEGYTHPHDDGHTDGSLAWAAVCYAAPGRVYGRVFMHDGEGYADPWPWPISDDKRGRSGADIITGLRQDMETRIDLLVKAGALSEHPPPFEPITR